MRIYTEISQVVKRQPELEDHEQFLNFFFFNLQSKNV